MTAKLKIDLTQGILEVEGSEVFVREIYRDFKVQFGGAAPEEEKKPTRRRSRRTKKSTKSAKSSKATETPEPVPQIKPSPYTYLTDLDLSGNAKRPSLVEFMDTKLPLTNEERNLVFVYYLEYTLQAQTITLDHVYTCYREANIRTPYNMEQSLQQMTAAKDNWIERADDGSYSVTPAGKRYVEERLPQTRFKG